MTKENKEKLFLYVSSYYPEITREEFDKLVIDELIFLTSKVFQKIKIEILEGVNERPINNLKACKNLLEFIKSCYQEFVDLKAQKELEKMNIIMEIQNFELNDN